MWWVGGGEGGGVAMGSFSSSFLSFIASMLYIRFSWELVYALANTNDIHNTHSCRVLNRIRPNHYEEAIYIT